MTDAEMGRFIIREVAPDPGADGNAAGGPVGAMREPMYSRGGDMLSDLNRMDLNKYTARRWVQDTDSNQRLIGRWRRIDGAYLYLGLDGPLDAATPGWFAGHPAMAPNEAQEVVAGPTLQEAQAQVDALWSVSGWYESGPGTGATAGLEPETGQLLAMRTTVRGHQVRVVLDDGVVVASARAPKPEQEAYPWGGWYTIGEQAAGADPTAAADALLASGPTP